MKTEAQRGDVFVEALLIYTFMFVYVYVYGQAQCVDNRGQLCELLSFYCVDFRN